MLEVVPEVVSGVVAGGGRGGVTFLFDLVSEEVEVEVEGGDGIGASVFCGVFD